VPFGTGTGNAFGHILNAIGASY
jgi:hypothetical protein